MRDNCGPLSAPELPQPHPPAVGRTTEMSKLLSVPPFLPSFLRGEEYEIEQNTSTAKPENEIDTQENILHCTSYSSPLDSVKKNTDGHSSLFDFSLMNSQQFAMLMELVPSEVQELLQVNISHLRNASGASSNEGIDCLRMRAACLTFNQLSFEQLSCVNDAWNMVFGEEDGDVNEDPDATFVYRDDGLLPDEEEWFFSQVMNNESGKATRSSRKLRRNN